MTDTSPQPERPDEKPHRRRRKGRWKTIALVASLALNLFIVAFILGQATRGYLDDGRRPFDRGSPRVDWGQVVDHLPREARDQARVIVRESGERMRVILPDLQRARDAAGRALLADPYDQDAARAAFAEVRQYTDQVQEVIQEGLLQLAIELTPEERRRLFERLPPPVRP